MRRLFAMSALASAAVWMAACGAPATNTPTNTNTNTNSKPTAAAPTVDALLALDKQANEAYFKGDTAFWQGFMSDKTVAFHNGKPMGKSEIMGMMGKVKCDMKSYSLDEPKMTMVDADNYVLVYKGTYDGSCNDGPEGKMQKAPSPIRAATLYNRNGDKWQAVWHSEVPIYDANAAKTDDKKAEAKPADEAKPAAGTEAKREEPKAADTEKKDDKTAASNTAANTNSNSSSTTAAAAPAKSANTDALMKGMQTGWEAWKNKDANAFQNMVTASILNIDPAGMVFSGKDEVIKHWTTMNCEGVTKVAATDGFSVAISPTVELLHLTGTADGKCDGHANGALSQYAVYVKEGETWKMAFMLEQMPGTGM